MTFRAEHGNAASRAYRSGKATIRQLAQRYKVGQRTVRKAFQEMGVPLHPPDYWHRHRRKFSHAEIIALYESGCSSMDIAEKTGLEKSGVLYILAKNNVPRRPVGSPSHKPKPHIAVIRTLLARGFSRRHITRVTGYNRWRVARVEDALGAPTRLSPLYRAWVERLAREAA